MGQERGTRGQLTVIDAAWWLEEAEVCRLAGDVDLERVCRAWAAARAYGGQTAVRWEQP